MSLTNGYGAGAYGLPLHSLSDMVARGNGPNSAPDGRLAMMLQHFSEEQGAPGQQSFPTPQPRQPVANGQGGFNPFGFAFGLMNGHRPQGFDHWKAKRMEMGLPFTGPRFRQTP